MTEPQMTPQRRQQILKKYFSSLEGSIEFFVKYYFVGKEHTAGPYPTALEAADQFDNIKTYEGIHDCRISIAVKPNKDGRE